MNNEPKASEVSCADLERYLYDYAEKDLDTETRHALDRHVLSCASCRVKVASYRKDSEQIKRHITKDIKLPPHFREELLQLLRTAGNP